MLSGHPVQYFFEIWKMEWGNFLLSRSQTCVGTCVCLVLCVMCIRRAQEEDLVQSWVGSSGGVWSAVPWLF